MKITRRSLLTYSAAAAAALPSMGSLAWAQTDGEKIRVVAGIDPTFSYLTVAVKKGFFEKEGVDADIKVFDDGNVALDNLLTGNAQIGSTSEVGSLVRRTKGGRICVVASGAQSADLYGVVGSDKIKGPMDLVGRTVGMPKGSGGHLYFGYLAKKIGLDLSKVTIKYLQTPEAIAALSRGDIDALAAWEPWLTRVTNTVQGTHVISRTGQDHAYFMNAYLLFSQDLVDNQELAKKSLKAIIAASDWIPGNWDEAVNIVSQANHMKAEDADAIMKLHTWKINFDKAAFINNFNNAGEFAKSQGLIEKLPDYDGFLRPELLQAVAPDRVK
jgi:NitT/TauT family transport system substrate-binding protein